MVAPECSGPDIAMTRTRIVYFSTTSWETLAYSRWRGAFLQVMDASAGLPTKMGLRANQDPVAIRSGLRIASVAKKRLVARQALEIFRSAFRTYGLRLVS
jgi:hypothetical protein